MADFIGICLFVCFFCFPGAAIAKQGRNIVSVTERRLISVVSVNHTNQFGKRCWVGVGVAVVPL